MSMSMISDGMQGGWNQAHVHSSEDNNSEVFHDAPDKEQKMPVISN